MSRHVGKGGWGGDEVSLGVTGYICTVQRHRHVPPRDCEASLHVPVPGAEARNSPTHLVSSTVLGQEGRKARGPEVITDLPLRKHVHHAQKCVHLAPRSGHMCIMEGKQSS